MENPVMKINSANGKFQSFFLSLKKQQSFFFWKENITFLMQTAFYKHESCVLINCSIKISLPVPVEFAVIAKSRDQIILIKHFGV